MIARLRCVLCSSCDEDPPIVCLNGAESDWNVKVDIEHLSLFPLVINVVERDYFLIKLKEMDFVGHDCLDLLLVLSVDHANTRLREVVCHGELRVTVEANVLLIVTLKVHLGIPRLVCFSSSTTRGIILVLTLSIVLVIQHLLEQKLMDFDITVVHDQIFRHEILESQAIDNVKLRISLESIYHLVDSLLKLIPVLLVFLDFALSP